MADFLVPGRLADSGKTFGDMVKSRPRALVHGLSPSKAGRRLSSSRVTGMGLANRCRPVAARCIWLRSEVTWNRLQRDVPRRAIKLIAGRGSSNRGSCS